jgi:hypothetical protein
MERIGTPVYLIQITSLDKTSFIKCFLLKEQRHFLILLILVHVHVVYWRSTANEVDWQQTTNDAHLIHVSSLLNNILILKQININNKLFTLTTARYLLRLKKRDATLKPWAVINMMMPMDITMLMTGGFLSCRLIHGT